MLRLYCRNFCAATAASPRRNVVAFDASDPRGAVLHAPVWSARHAAGAARRGHRAVGLHVRSSERTPVTLLSLGRRGCFTARLARVAHDDRSGEPQTAGRHSHTATSIAGGRTSIKAS